MSVMACTQSWTAEEAETGRSLRLMDLPAFLVIKFQANERSCLRNGEREGGEERRGKGRGGEGSVVKYLAAPLEDLSLITSTQNQ